jgi:hypothetical protein
VFGNETWTMQKHVGPGGVVFSTDSFIPADDEPEGYKRPPLGPFLPDGNLTSSPSSGRGGPGVLEALK